MIGVGDGDSLLTTGVYGVVKFVTVIFYVGYLVENVGRRLPLLVGSIIQASCLLYLAIYIKFAGENATNEGGSPPAGGIVGAVAIYLYAFGWSFGHSVACYVVAAEIFPARIVSGAPPRGGTLPTAITYYHHLLHITHALKLALTYHRTALVLPIVLFIHELDSQLWYYPRNAEFDF